MDTDAFTPPEKDNEQLALGWAVLGVVTAVVQLVGSAVLFALTWPPGIVLWANLVVGAGFARSTRHTASGLTGAVVMGVASIPTIVILLALTGDSPGAMFGRLLGWAFAGSLSGYLGLSYGERSASGDDISDRLLDD